MTAKEDKERGRLTSCRAQIEGQVRKAEENQWVRGTDSLSGAYGVTFQDIGRYPKSKEYPPTVERRGRDKLGQRTKASERGGLTSCRAQR
jgi:hypothetical protein